MTPQDLEHLRAAIAASRDASRRGDEPYGATLVAEHGKVLLAAGNTQVTERDCTGHAEANLLRAATRRFDAGTLARCTVYASGEPCPMCAGAIYWSGVRRVVFALDIARMRALAGPGADELLLGCRDVLAHGMHPVEVLGPALADEAAAVLEAHYSARTGRPAHG
jgi:tRNA(Arg) A34 adenosine deaminase TadA